MFAAVIVDDPNTTLDDPNNVLQQIGLGPIGLDLGETITLVNGIEIPTASDLALRLVKTDFMITDPNNWKDYNIQLATKVSSCPGDCVRCETGSE